MMASGGDQTNFSISRFSKKSKGGAIASKVEHQDSAGSVLALEAIGGLIPHVPPDIVSNQGYIGCEWDQDLEIHWPAGALFVQVKDQVLDIRDVRTICIDFEQLAKSYDVNRGPGFLSAFRIEALAGVATSVKSLVSDLEHLGNLPAAELERNSGALIRDLSERWQLPARVCRSLTVSVRDLRRDSLGAVALFAHLMRKVYPVYDYTDARLMNMWESLASGHFAPARRNRAPVMLSAIEESVLKPLIPFYLLRYEVEYVRTSYGYVVDPERLKKLKEEAALGTRALHKAMRTWRRYTRKDRILNMLYRGNVRCPVCNAPMMANLWGRNGTACPHCGYSPYLTLVYVCDCEELIPILEQPELASMGIFGQAVSILRSRKITCGSCSAEPRFENLHIRLSMVPFPLPVSKFSEKELVDTRIRLGWRRSVWPFPDITPIEKMIADDEQSSKSDPI